MITPQSLLSPPLLYIDPNSGGILLQFLLPMFVAIGAFWVAFKEKLSSKISRIYKSKLNREK